MTKNNTAKVITGKGMLKSIEPQGTPNGKVITIQDNGPMAETLVVNGVMFGFESAFIAKQDD